MEEEGLEMRQLSFGAQMLICFVVVVAGHCAAAAFDSPVLFNIASGIGGAAFAVHPVLPAWITWGNKKAMLNAVRVGGVLAIALALLTRFDV